MPKKSEPSSFAVVDALSHAWGTNNRINLYLIENLPEAAWRAETPEGKGRNIASITAHIHNVRLMWLKSLGVPSLPPKIDPETVTKKEATDALAASSKTIEVALRQALESDGRVKGFKPNAASFFAYLIAHDAHHRGQIAMLARQVGHPLPKSAGFGMWEWGTR